MHNTNGNESPPAALAAWEAAAAAETAYGETAPADGETAAACAAFPIVAAKLHGRMR